MKFRTSDFRELSKSGIVALVLISVLGGYLIGQPLEIPFDAPRLIETLLGILLLASGSSALNQLQEIKIDAKMPRTALRPLPSGRMTVAQVAVFVVLTVCAGLLLLLHLDWGLAALGLAALVSYNVLYTLWWKKHWSHAAVPGAIPGALPILMGYYSAAHLAGHSVLDPGGIYLFAILFFWQMPHFWVLALRFKKDYALGEIPTLPVTHGESVTVTQIAIWGLAYIGIGLIAPLFLPVGLVYLVIALITSLIVLWELVRFARSAEPAKRWLRFFLWVNFSLIFYVGGAAIDLWSHYLLIPLLTR